MAACPPSDDLDNGSSDGRDLILGRGIDFGREDFVSAVQDESGSVTLKIVPNACLDIPPGDPDRGELEKISAQYRGARDGNTVIGEAAIRLGRRIGRDTRQAITSVVLSPEDEGLMPALRFMTAGILGRPKAPGEKCFFSVPADLAGGGRLDVAYHRSALERMISGLGFTAKSILEGHAVVFSELADEDFSGIGVSCNDEMLNLCLAHRAIPVMAFSILRPAEGGIEAMVRLALETARDRLKSSGGLPPLSKPPSVICAGTQSVPEGFITMFKDELARVDLPFEITSVRRAEAPRATVAKGALVAAISS